MPHQTVNNHRKDSTPQHRLLIFPMLPSHNPSLDTTLPQSLVSTMQNVARAITAHDTKPAPGTRAAPFLAIGLHDKICLKGDHHDRTD